MKTEPDVFSIEDLVKRPGQTELWDGVRNYQARNFMMNDMKVGDLVLFYHSNAEPSGVAGVAEVVKPAQPDPSSWNSESEYFDPKSTPENPRWFCVTVGRPRPFSRFVTLDELKQHSALKDMMVLRKGQRLSIQPVQPSEFEFVVSLGMKS
ncbi:MAG: EVE domain-containing protein [Silvanigrellaceae bacterium]